MKSQSRRQRYVNLTLLQLSGKSKSWQCQSASMSFINVPEQCPVVVHTQSPSPPWCCPYLLEFLALSDGDRATLMRLPLHSREFWNLGNTIRRKKIMKPWWSNGREKVFYPSSPKCIFCATQIAGKLLLSERHWRNGESEIKEPNSCQPQ